MMTVLNGQERTIEQLNKILRMEVITGLPYALLRRRPPTGSSCPGSRVIVLYNILRNCGAILE